MQKQSVLWPDGLVGRMQAVASKAGGKRALAKALGISESQLFRYFRQANEPPLSVLMRMADVGQMPLPWLLSGPQQGLGEHDYIDTVSQITRLLERVCQETGRQYTPEQKSQIVALMVLVAQHERQQGLLPQLFRKSMVLEACYFLDALLPDDLLDVYTGALKAWTTGTLTADNQRQLSYMITRANSHLFDGKVGDLFFERVGFDITPQRHTHMQQIMQRLQQLVGIYTPLKLVDLGCGNGRYMFHIEKQYGRALEKIWGVDASQNAIRRAQNYALKTNSQKTTLLCGSIDDVNLADGGANAILCTQALPYIPCFMNGESGAAAIFKEMYRLL